MRTILLSLLLLTSTSAFAGNTFNFTCTTQTSSPVTISGFVGNYNLGSLDVEAVDDDLIKDWKVDVSHVVQFKAFNDELFILVLDPETQEVKLKVDSRSEKASISATLSGAEYHFQDKKISCSLE